MSISRRKRHKRRSPLQWASIFGVGLLWLCAQPANAQVAPGATNEIAQLIDDLNDIDAMRPLLPLKLTASQMDKMIALISEAQSNYDRRLKAVAGPALTRLADRIKVVKSKTLKGEAIPKDFDSLAKEAETEILTKRKTIDAETVSGIATAMETILTPEQMKLAGKLDRDALIKLNKATANTQRTDELWFASYVKDAIFTVPRIVLVLKQMRSATEGDKAADSGAGTTSK